MSKSKLITLPAKRRGRPPKNVLPILVVKKRGRPPKNSVAPATITEKRKRGRPPKALAKQVITDIVKRKRGRPPKSQVLAQPQAVKTKIEKRAVKGKPASESVRPKNNILLFKDFVDAKAFLGKKERSKQIPEFQTWLDEFNQTVADNDNKKLVEIIPELSKMINKVLEEQSFKDQVHIHICLIRLMVDDEVRAVEFEPFEKGIKCKIFYKLKGLPIGLAKKQKDDVVCNKITSALEKFVPIGFCC